MRRILTIFAVAVTLAACGKLIEATAPTEAWAFAQQFIALLQAKDFDAISARLDRSARASDPETRTKLQALAQCLTDARPDVASLRGWRVGTTADGATRYSFLIEYKLPDRWLSASLALRRQQNSFVVTGTHCQANSESLSEQASKDFKSIFSLRDLLPIRNSLAFYALLGCIAFLPGLVFVGVVMITRRSTSKQK